MDDRRPSLLPHSGVIGAGLFAITLVAFLRPPLLPAIGRDLDLSMFGLAGLTAAFACGRLVADIPAGTATDRYDLGRMMGFAAGLVAVGTAVMAAATTKPMLIAASFILGVGSSWTLAAGIAFFAGAPKASRGTSVSVFGGSLLAAQAIGPAVAGLAALLLDWRIVLAVGAGASVVAAGALGRARTRKASGQPWPPGAKPTVVPRRVLWILYALPGLQFAIGGAVIQTFVPVVGEGTLRLSSGVVGAAIGVGGLLRIVATLTAGRVSDRFGRKAALVPGLALQTAGLVVWAASQQSGQNQVGWWATIVLLSLGSIGVNVGSTILADVSDGGPLGRRLGNFRLAGDAAFLVGPLVAGYLFEVLDPGRAVLPILIPAALVTVAAVRLPETG